MNGINDESKLITWIAQIRAGEELPSNKKVERNQKRIAEILKHYQNNNLLNVLEGLSFNFDL